jgi:hypothetical protein
MRDFYFSNEDATPWYIRELMDRDSVHLTVQDLVDPERNDEIIHDEDKKVNSDFVCFLLSPSVLRQLGLNPEGLYTLKDYKEKAMGLIKLVAPVELLSSAGVFRKKIQGFLNQILNSLYNLDSIDEAKSLVRDVLDLLGVDYPLEAISEVEVVLYNTTYLSFTKILFLLGLFDPEEFRFRNLNSHYVKKVPQPNLWDIKDFLESEVDFISSAFYRSFVLSKENPSDKRWAVLYDEAESALGLVDLLITKVPSISTRNQKKEVWVLNTHDFFWSVLRKKILTLVELIPQGLREEFASFHLPEEVQKRINPRVVYRPWVKK